MAIVVGSTIAVLAAVPIAVTMGPQGTASAVVAQVLPQVPAGNALGLKIAALVDAWIAKMTDLQGSVNAVARTQDPAQGPAQVAPLQPQGIGIVAGVVAARE